MKKIFLSLFLIMVSLNANLTDDGIAAYNSGDKQKASKLFKKACDGGNITACFNLGIMYDNGYGVRQNKQTASKLWKKACDGGNITSCYNLGILYFNGKGIEKNKSKATKLFKKACDGGNSSGCLNYKILRYYKNKM